jgi:hypothetical protein
VQVEERKGWLSKLQDRWGLKSLFQVVVVLFVFACTGTTILLIKNPILSLIDPSFKDSVLFNILYLVFILPIYNIVLLIYGFIFGQFQFFWEFEKRFFRRMTGRK